MQDNTQLSDNTAKDETALATQFNLNAEAKELLSQIIVETDEQKAQNLVQLFNANQNKKTMVRVDKLSNLLDTITDQALLRFSAKPDEISNKELFDGLKIVQDLIERGQKQATGVNGASPLIQFNQQNNEVNLGNASSNLNRDSRERVKSAVLSLLGSISAAAQPDTQSQYDSEDAKLEEV
jgi:hypothetical protein